MSNLGPWLAIAGLGALHGAMPANGWMFAAARGVRAGSAAEARHALLPIGLGHAASVAVVACVMALGLSMDRSLYQGVAGALLVGMAIARLLRGGARPCVPVGAMAGSAGMALWSFLMGSTHGAGMMLVPALVPLCLADNPAREITASGSLLLALAAVGVHTVAMLVTTGAIATGVCCGVALHAKVLSSRAPRYAWTATLAVTGVLLMALR
jgi:hypothetical protein